MRTLVFVAVSMCLVGFGATLLACSEDGGGVPMGDGGGVPMGDGGGGVPSCDQCDVDGVVATCSYCQAYGCDMAARETSRCYIGVVHYTDMVGCMQRTEVQANCPQCEGVGFWYVFDAQCIACASKWSPCSFNCAIAAGVDK